MKKRIGIIGAGILGLAVAYRVQERYPCAKVWVFEKEGGPGRHQSSHNSGVLHCGLYYQPGSLKARLAVEGIRSMIDFCRQHEIPHEVCGKVVVASDARERQFLENLARRGAANGLKGLKFLGTSELKNREPFVRASSSLLVPEEGIVDYLAVMDSLAGIIQYKGGHLQYNSPVRAVKSHHGSGTVVVETPQRETEVDLLVCCAGLHADRLYRACTSEMPPLKIVPFRGEYRMLRQEAERLVNHLVYPVPDPAYPFLGVHFTRLVHGGREVGPNAVLAFKREGYHGSDFSLSDTLDSVTYKGFLRFLVRNFRFTAGEFSSSFSDRAFLVKAQKMIPDITQDQLVSGTAGVRAQAVAPDGTLVMDFSIIRHDSQIHVLNAPSPGATASLAIAGHIVKEYVH
ncbi:MAG: L-2-hydroxyglutarate oxidase [Chlorobium limicola]|uniref:L-2-hydroxyglutarate oxidase n=1 Tax=Chlorobium limicola TaxID=1092 RepID=UPI0023EFCF2B|nr:L-2-hydroxyglutarate oxidase [Chlorobium limicola]NTV20921.1 L-2-hydroxyglutarate oxidase [Chlorobium limicola]